LKARERLQKKRFLDVLRVLSFLILLHGTHSQTKQFLILAFVAAVNVDHNGVVVEQSDNMRLVLGATA